MNYRSSFFILTCIGLGFAFLYIPILSLVVFSFSPSRLVKVCDTAHPPTPKRSPTLVHNGAILYPSWRSLRGSPG